MTHDVIIMLFTQSVSHIMIGGLGIKCLNACILIQITLFYALLRSFFGLFHCLVKGASIVRKTKVAFTEA